MAGKRVQLTYVGGRGPRQRIWDEIRKHHAKWPKKPFTLRDVSPDDVLPATGRSYLEGLQAAGIITSTAGLPKRGEWRGFHLVVDNGIEAPRVRKDGTPVTQGLATEQMWRTLRMNAPADINAKELAASASTPDIPVAERAAKDYLVKLNQAGFLQETYKGHAPAKGVAARQSRYKLLRNSGPRAPMVCRIRAVYDPNTAETYPIEQGCEEEAIYGS